jgi:hypothetical protein
MSREMADPERDRRQGRSLIAARRLFFRSSALEIEHGMPTDYSKGNLDVDAVYVTRVEFDGNAHRAA